MWWGGGRGLEVCDDRVCCVSGLNDVSFLFVLGSD